MAKGKGKNVTKVIGKFFKDKREAAGFTQADVAEKLGYTSPQFISNIERGKCVVPMKVISTFTKLYNVKPDTVVTLLTKAFRENLERSL